MNKIPVTIISLVWFSIKFARGFSEINKMKYRTVLLIGENTQEDQHNASEIPEMSFECSSSK